MRRYNVNSKLIKFISILLFAVILVVWFGVGSARRSLPQDSKSGSSDGRPAAFPSLSSLLTLPRESLNNLDIARLNLRCTENLAGAEQFDEKQYLALLSEMANRVHSETKRHTYRFQKNPAEFENSEGFFRMLMMTVVLAEDFRISYDPSRKAAVLNNGDQDGFFADSANVFLHGLLGPKRQGTCSSMPVLYVAVGRRLGYPLKLVTTKGHLFVRWEGAGERFNVEATSHGLNRFSDDYYRHWPFTITAGEEALEGYLKSLSVEEELACFLSIRGMCLKEAGRFSEAAIVFARAAKLAPGCFSYARMASELGKKTRSG